MSKRFLLGAIGGVLGGLLIAKTGVVSRRIQDQMFIIFFVGGVGALIGLKLDQEDEEPEVGD
jgi:hypothetical protein